MECQTCGKERLLHLSAKASDCFSWRINGGEDLGKRNFGYLLHDFGIGGGDYLDFTFCLDCGQIQGKFPLEQTETEIEGQPDER